MKYIGKFEKYEPLERAAPNANHLKNSDGVDWYDISWDRHITSNNLFLCTNDNDYIICATKEGHTLYPENMHVFLIDKNDKLYNKHPDYFYHGKIINLEFLEKDKNDEFIVNRNKNKINYIKRELKNEISVLHSQLLLDMISSDDKLKLEELIEYYKKIQSLDVNDINMVIPEINL